MNRDIVKEILYITIAILLSVLTVKFVIWLFPVILIIILALIIYSSIKKNKMEEEITKQQKEKNIKEVCDFLKKIKTFYLATVDGDQPRVRPMGVAEIYEDRLYIQTGKVKNVSKQMAANPKIEICGFDGNTWLRIEAEAVRDERREVKEYVLDQNPGLKRMYSADDDNTEVLYHKNATATFSSFTSEPKTVKF